MELVYTTMLNTSKLQFWTEVFKGFGNKNRLKILDLLNKNEVMSVSELAKELEIAHKNTSRNLRILANLDLLIYKGKNDRVYYKINPDMEREVEQILKIVLS